MGCVLAPRAFPSLVVVDWGVSGFPCTRESARGRHPPPNGQHPYSACSGTSCNQSQGALLLTLWETGVCVAWSRSAPATAAVPAWSHVGGTGQKSHRKPIPGVRGAVNLQMAMGWLAERNGLGDHWEVPRPRKLHSRAEAVQPEEELVKPGRDLASRLRLDTSADRLRLRAHARAGPLPTA